MISAIHRGSGKHKPSWEESTLHCSPESTPHHHRPTPRITTPLLSLPSSPPFSSLYNLFPVDKNRITSTTPFFFFFLLPCPPPRSSSSSSSSSQQRRGIRRGRAEEVVGMQSSAMAKRLSFQFFLGLLLGFFLALLPVSSAAAAVAKDGVSCTMCSSCDNPCHPLYSPPPPVPSLPPPDTSSSNCPPPPSPPSSGAYYYSPPPPSTSYVYASPPPPSGDGGIPGSYAFPPPYITYPAPPPPNPIMPYFPFYYYSPPPFKTSGGSPRLIFPLASTLPLLLLPFLLFF